MSVVKLSIVRVRAQMWVWRLWVCHLLSWLRWGGRDWGLVLGWGDGGGMVGGSIYRSSANLRVRPSKSSGSTSGIAVASCSLVGSFRVSRRTGLKHRYHSTSRSRYFSALIFRTSSLLTTCLTRWLTNLLFVTMSSPLSTLSIQSLTGNIFITPRPTSCSRGYTSAGTSACMLGLGIGFASSIADCISSWEGKKAEDAVIESRIIESAGSRAGFAGED